jgi:galactokinase
MNNVDHIDHPTTTRLLSLVLQLQHLLLLTLLVPSSLGFSLPVTTMEGKIEGAKSLFAKHFPDQIATTIAVAPGRVNLIGEHTDYTGGFVLPFAIDFCTLVYGKGAVKDGSEDDSASDDHEAKDEAKDDHESPSTQERRAVLRFVSDKFTEEVEIIEITESSVPPETTSWTTYVVGTVFQYLVDLPPPGGHGGSTLDLTFCIVGDVPLGSGLSSSASLEVAVARFVEAILEGAAFSGETKMKSPSKIRALRCRRAENEWCHSPCGIMDQAISSAAKAGSLLLIDCRSLDFTETKMGPASGGEDGEDENSSSPPVLVVANSNVKHDIAGGEYPVRVAQCQTATEALHQIRPEIEMLRDATVDDVEAAKDLMDETSYKRARHVTSENQRTLQAKEALERGDWAAVGELMNASHASMRDDYEVSCDEIDVLVNLAQNFPGVYGSRLTGGGFGGCTVTLVSKEQAAALIAHLGQEYEAKTGKECFCFETQPARGAHLLSIRNHMPFV